MKSLKDIKHLVIDMDGVLYVGNRPMDCLPEFIAFLRRAGIGFMMATNNSGLTPTQYAAKLAKMGAEVSPAGDPDLGHRHRCVAGAASIRPARASTCSARIRCAQAMTDVGFVLADEDVEVVAASIDWGVNFEKIKRAVLLIRKGALFVATNLDPTRPTEEGLVPGTGAIIASIAVGAETQPMAIGKPEPTMFELAMAQMGATPDTTATLGDRIDTDMHGGVRAGCSTILVLSGSTGREEAEAYGPDFIFEDIAHLLREWQAQR